MMAVYLVLGVLFGITLTKAEVISWFRIQEMFRFQAFHMYGIIGSAIAVAAVGRRLVRRGAVEQVEKMCGGVTPEAVQERGTRYWAGGAMFGLGWALTGACPGPLFVLLGGGVSVMVVAVASALAGTWVYGAVRERLPH